MNRRIFKDQTSQSGDIPFFKIGTFGEQPDAFISRSLFEEYKSKYPYPKVGDLLISASGSIGRIVEYTGKDEYFQDSNIVWLDHDDCLNNSFLKQFYSVVKWQGLEGSTIKRLYNKNILNTTINMPSVQEQSAIGNFLGKLDNTIALHERKLNLLKELKKAYLQFLFPTNGHRIPSLRFSGFTDEWEQRKLSNLAKFGRGTGFSKSDITKEGIPIILYGSMYTNYQTVINQVNTYVAPESEGLKSIGGEVIVPASGETAVDISRASVVAKPGILLGGDLNIIYPTKDVDPEFLALTISNGRQKAEMVQRAQGASIVHLHNADLKQITLNFPTIGEQHEISSFISHLENAIALHQQQCEKLESLKLAYLEKLFV